MKFISKAANLHIILRPGMSAQPLTGSPAVATLSVRFQNGVAEVEQEELVKMMMAHNGFNRDFVAADTTGTDPYAYLRSDSEPTHVIEELKFGTPVSRSVSPSKNPLPPEIKKLIQDQATEIAKQMLPGLLKDVLSAHQASKAPVAAPTKPKGKGGRPRKNPLPVEVAATEETQTTTPEI